MPSAVRSSTSHLLSFAQMGAWLRGQEKGPAHQYVALYRLNGHLQVAALEHGLNELVRRHEVLRTTYQNLGSGPAQAIHDAHPLSLRTVDLRSLPESAREARARELAAAEAGRNPDLSRDPMLRATLLQLHDEQHFLLLVAHEIAWDGWSSGIAIRELLAFYDGAVAPGAVVPSNLPVQYADFVEQQREWLRGGQVQEQLAYWKAPA